MCVSVTATLVVVLAVSGCGDKGDDSKLSATHSVGGLTGSELFSQKCVQCHGTNVTIGPSLRSVYGREAGSLPGFEYSDAIRHSNIKWDRENLILLMLDPQGLMPGCMSSKVLGPQGLFS